MKKAIYQHVLWALSLLLFGFACQKSVRPNLSLYRNWQVYGGTNDQARFSALDQINTQNVQNLRVAWTYRSGDATETSQIQCNPIIVDGVMYCSTPGLRVVAIDAATGREIWRFAPFEHWGGDNSWAGTNRGLNFWADGEDRRLLFCIGQSLIALDARTGRPIANFGEGGRVDLQQNLDYHKKEFFIFYNTPGMVYKDLIVIGSRVSEGLDGAPGHIRAYDVRTGQRRWIFHTIPYPGEPGFETWQDTSAWRKIGGANCWAGMALDEKRGILFVPTGSATFDFWGGYRLGSNLYANCLLALDAATGHLIWHFQSVHHDVWDRDFPAPPNLVTIQKEGKTIDAVAQISKQGYTYVFERTTGKPVFPIEERPVPNNSSLGDQIWPTQPIPTAPEPFMRQKFEEADIVNISPTHHAEILPRFRALQSGDMWNPPSAQGIVHFPGMDGGAEWGGASFDPMSGWLYVNASEMPWIIKMVENEAFKRNTQLAPGEKIYLQHCATCHSPNRAGNGANFPSLLHLNDQYKATSLDALLVSGKGAMPSFKHLNVSERRQLADFLLNEKSVQTSKESMLASSDLISPWLLDGYQRFTTTDGYPAICPPWGTLNAINLSTGKIEWKTRLGELPELTAKGIAPTGTENYGGPVATAGGLLFIAATKDEKFRAFDKKTGRVLWETKLPAGGYATPAVFEVAGKQYVVVACGGGKMGTRSGDYYVCFSL